LLCVYTQVETIEEMQYDDAFTIQKVHKDLVEIFNHMAGMVPFIQKLIADVCDIYYSFLNSKKYNCMHL
jgi:hypothetical protein